MPDLAVAACWYVITHMARDLGGELVLAILCSPLYLFQLVWNLCVRQSCVDVALVALVAVLVLLWRTSFGRLCVDRAQSAIGDMFATRFNTNARYQVQRHLKRIRYGKLRASHPHPESARDRNSATETMHSTVSAMGRTAYVISPSTRESEHACRRFYYTAADLTQQFAEHVVPDDAVIVMTDVDYYADMPCIISLLKPMLFYTFCPETVSGPISEGYFTISNNEVKYRVAGGKTVCHPIWDYSQDHIVTPYHRDTLWGGIMDAAARVLGYESFYSVVSTVDVWRTEKHRRIVSVIPTVVTPSWELALFSGTPLKRVKYNNAPGFNSVICYGGKTDSGEHSPPQISIGREGEVACANLPLRDLEGLRVAHSFASSKHLSDTARRSKLDVVESAILHAYLQETAGPTAEQYYPRDATHYQVLMPDSDAHDVYKVPKPYGRKYASAPLGHHEAVFPHETEENARASIAGRVSKPQQTARDAVIPTIYSEYAREFVNMVVGDAASTGSPMSTSEVHDIQNRPTQRVRSNARTWDWKEYFRVLAFQKREAYPAANDPRNISSVPTTHTLNLSAFTLQFKQAVLKRMWWYSPGLTPAEIANSVCDLASGTDRIVMTDFSRFDGHINEFLRVRVERACYLKWLKPEHRDEFGELFDSELNPKARQGAIKYDPGCSRLSGSPLTTDGNTIINAYYQYVVARSAGFSAEDAWECIGLVCGDDGLQSACGIKPSIRVGVAKKMGLTVTIDGSAGPGEPVTYLSRVFRDPWSTPASIQSPKRALSKIHLTVDATVPLDEAGVAKASGYLVTDPTTPLLSNWAKCYLRNVGDVEASATGRDVPYYSTREFLNSPWPTGDGFEEIVAEQLGVTAGELADHCAKLDNYKGTVDNIPSLDIPVAQPKVDVVMNGEVHRAGSPKQDKKPVARDPTIQKDAKHGSETGRTSNRPRGDGSSRVEGGGLRDATRSGGTPPVQARKLQGGGPAHTGSRSAKSDPADPGTPVQPTQHAANRRARAAPGGSGPRPPTQPATTGTDNPSGPAQPVLSPSSDSTHGGGRRRRRRRTPAKRAPVNA